jgi:beta-lactam-binding protein with PASTA domain
MVCERCGRENPVGSAFCGNGACNAYLGWQVRATAAEQPPLIALPALPSGTQPSEMLDASGNSSPPPPPLSFSSPAQPTVSDLPAPQGAAVSPSHRSGLVLTLEPVTSTVEPGANAQLSLTVRNVGAIIESCSVTVLGVPSSWVTMDHATVHLGLGQAEVVRIELCPPRAPSTPPGFVPFQIAVVSNVDGSVRADQHGSLAVGAFSEVVAHLVVADSESRRVGHHRVLIANAGNSTIRPRIMTVDRSGRLSFSTNPSVVELAPGTDRAVALLVTPKRRAWVGEPIRHAFTVEVDGAAQPAAHANFSQSTIVPRWTLRVITGVLVVALAFGVPYTLRRLHARDRNKPVAVPELTKQTRELAVASLGRLGFAPVFAEAPSSAEDEVVGQDPAAGQRLAVGSRVTLTIGSRKPNVAVPAVVGLTFGDALAALNQAGLTGQQSLQTVETGTPGQVTDQVPPGGQAPQGSTVVLTMGIGPGHAQVPLLTSATRQQAQDELAKAGFTQPPAFVPIGKPSADIAPDMVLESLPAAGTEVERTTVIQLILSLGPPVRDVPLSTAGATPDAARALLEKAGFRVGVATQPKETTGASIGKVLALLATGYNDGQATAAQGTEFTLVVGTGRTSAAVPHMSKAKATDAVAKLVAANLSLGATKSESDPKVASGLVLRTEPPAGAKVNVGTAVDLVVSNGPPVAVSPVIGKTVAQATQELAAVDLIATPLFFCGDTSTVTTQTPDKGNVARQTAVTLGCNVLFPISPIIVSNAIDMSKLTPIAVKK